MGWFGWVFQVAHVVALWCLVLALLYRDALTRPTHPVHAAQGTDAPAADCKPPPSVVHFAQRVALPGGVGAALLHVGSDGRLRRVHPSTVRAASSYADAVGGAFVDHSPLTISPGLIDIHVHISAVGGRGWEGFASATRAAAAGGVTTIIGMPLNSLPPTVTTTALQAEAAQADAEGLLVEVGFWAGVVPSSLADGSFAALLADPRVLGAKAFLSPLPAAAGYEALSVLQLAEAARLLAPTGLPLLVHAELMSAEEVAQLEAAARAANASRRFATFLSTRPPLFERRALEALATLLTQLPSLRVHVVHLSDASSLPLLAEAKREAAGRLTVETCPHYLRYAAEAIPDGETRLKCFPPIRSAANRERLWAGLANDTIDLIASDHSPCAPYMRHLRDGDFLSAWAGISGLQFSLPATWTEAKRRGYGVDAIARWWSEKPAALAGLSHVKGSLREGLDADFVVWDPASEIIADRVYHRHAGSPYAGQLLDGKVMQTFMRGRSVFVQDDVHGGRVLEVGHQGERLACGRILPRVAHR